MNSPGASSRRDARVSSSPSDGGPSVALPATSRRAATPTTGSPSDSSWTANCLTITLTGNSGRIGCGAGLSGGGGRGRQRAPQELHMADRELVDLQPRLNSASRLQISRTLSIFSHGPSRSESTMSRIVALEESTPSTAPIETLSSARTAPARSGSPARPCPPRRRAPARKRRSARRAAPPALTCLMRRKASSESLPDADIDRHGRVARWRCERERDVETDRADRGDSSAAPGRPTYTGAG